MKLNAHSPFEWSFFHCVTQNPRTFTSLKMRALWTESLDSELRGKVSLWKVMLNLRVCRRFHLTTGTVTGCLAIPPYVTIDPRILEDMGITAFYDQIFSSMPDIRSLQQRSASLLQMTEQLCGALASNSIQCQFRPWTGLFKRKKKMVSMLLVHHTEN